MFFIQPSSTGILSYYPSIIQSWRGGCRRTVRLYREVNHTGDRNSILWRGGGQIACSLFILSLPHFIRFQKKTIKK